MGAWANIDEEEKALQEKIEGLAKELLTDRETKQFDVDEVTGERVEAAKGVVRRKLFGSDSLSGQIDRYSSPEAFLDALAGDAKLADQVIEAIAYAFLHVHTSTNRLAGEGRLARQSKGFESDIDQQIDALAATAPFVLGWTSDSGSFQGGGVESTLDRYG